jgi:hypothetical protein
LLSIISHLRCFRANIVKFKRLPFIQNPWGYFRRWHQSLLRKSNPIKERVPWITLTAFDWCEQYVKPEWRVFEYGMGGSSLYWLGKGCTVEAVEHDAGWYQKFPRTLDKQLRLKVH